MGKKQIAGFIASPDWIEAPALSKNYIKEIVEHGYGVTALFVRHQRRSVFNERVRDAVAQITDLCHANGLKILLDTDPTFWALDFVESHPETALQLIKSVDTFSYDGNFEFKVPLPKDEMYSPCLFKEVTAVFIQEGESYRRVPSCDISYEWINVYQGVLIKGSINGRFSGRLVFYIAFQTFGLADISHPLYLEGQKQMLSLYKDVPLDGFGWDKPGKYVSQNFFKWGGFFPKFFQIVNGYDLPSKLIYLDRCDNSEEAVKVRCDYYRTLSEMSFIAQKEHNDYARSLFGDDLIFGTHQTWSGIPADLAGGVMDYFKLGKVLTASWTDGSWDCSQFKYQAYFFMLAESIRKELGIRDAYYNDWGYSMPAVENMRLANRFKMLFHVNWFNIFFSDSSESLLNYRLEPLKSYAKQDVKHLDEFDLFVGDNFHPHTDIAVLYSWETVASAPKWLMRLYYMMFANLSLNLADSGMFGVQVSSDAISEAVIKKDSFFIGKYQYRVLIVPYGYVLPEKVYMKIKELCKAGIHVIFFGPAPEFEAESGKKILQDFSQLVGIKEFSFSDYQAIYDGEAGLPSPYEWEPSWADFSCPISAVDGYAAKDREGRVLYVKSNTASLYYMPQPDPREDIINLLRELLIQDCDVFADGTYYRYYRNPKEKDVLVVVAVAKGHIAGFDLTPASYGAELKAPVKEHCIKILLRFKEGELVMEGGSWCAVKISNGKITDKIGDCPNIIWKGREGNERG